MIASSPGATSIASSEYGSNIPDSLPSTTRCGSIALGRTPRSSPDAVVARYRLPIAPSSAWCALNPIFEYLKTP